MIKVAIVGYGNLGKGIEIGLKNNPDMQCVGIFTRRDPETLMSLGSPVYSYDRLMDGLDIDVCILCGGSAKDLPLQTPQLASLYNVIDTYDNHGLIPQHFDAVDKVAKESKKTALISSGWDPGIFSIMRLLGQSILPSGRTETFWGKGVSQGHSDALRRIKGVKNAVQYTIPKADAIEGLREDINLELSIKDKHLRECYIVLDDGVDKEVIRNEILTMPHYFADYDTIVHFIEEDELLKNHSDMPHGGLVIRQGKLSEDNQALMEFSLKLDSNPEYTASVVLAYTRAVYRMHEAGYHGALSVLDVAPKYLSPKSSAQLRKELL